MTLHVSPSSTATGMSRVARGFALALAAALVAGAVSTGASASAAPTTITISGHVTEEATGAGIPAIEVALYPEFSVASSENDFPLDWKETTATGGYSFKNVKPGRYRISFSADYADANVLGQFVGGKPGDFSGEVDSVSYTQSTVVDQALVPGATATGRLLTTAGKAIKNADITVATSANTAVSYRSDSAGRFELWGLNPGDADIYLSGPSGSNYANTKIAVSGLEAGENRALGTFTLSAGASIAGVVTKANGSRAVDTLLFAFPVTDDGIVDSEAYGFALTNKRGEYRMTNLPAGDFVVTSLDFIDILDGGGVDFAGGSDDPYAAVRIPAATAGVKVYRDIRLSGGVRLSGTVKTATGKPAADIPVLAVQNDYSPMINAALGLSTDTDESATVPVKALAKAMKERADKQAAALPESAKKLLERAGVPATTPTSYVFTESDGTYSLSGLAPGASYTLYFGDNYFAGSLSGATDVESVQLASSRNVLDATLSATSPVKGTVTSKSGTPLESVTVEAIPYVDPSAPAARREPTVDNMTVFGPIGDYTDSKGRYTLRLPAGTWVLRFGDDEQKLGARYLGGGTYPSEATTTKIETTGATVSGQNIVLGNSGATISATVTSAEGFEEVEGDVWLDRIVDGIVVDTTYVYNNSAEWYYLDDSFPLRRVVDGDYRLRFDVPSYYDNYRLPETVTDFTIAGGNVTSVNGEDRTPSKSLGTIVLEPAERIIAVSDAELSISPDSSLTVGTRLHADLGEAEGNGQTVYYQWYRDGSPIGSAFSADYVVQPGDIGSRLSFAALTSANSLGILSAAPNVSPSTGVVADGEFPLESGTPTIDGSGAAGATLTAIPANESGESFKYQWRINGVDFIGATKSTFTPQTGNLGDTISVAVATDGGDALVSNRVVVTKAAPVTSSSTTATVLVGGKKMNTSRLGAVLTVTSTLPKDSLVVSYQWEYATKGTNWKPLAGKDRPTLTLSKKTTSTSKIGYSYRVVVTAERSGTEAGPVVTSKAVKVTKAAKK